MQSSNQSATERYKRILNLLLSPFLSPFLMVVLIIGVLWVVLNGIVHKREDYNEIIHQQTIEHSKKSPELEWAIEEYKTCVYQEKYKYMFDRLWEVCRQPILLRGEITGVGKEVDAAILAFHAGVAESVKNTGIRLAY